MINLRDDFEPYLRDGVDIYLSEGRVATFVFLSTRKRVSMDLEPLFVKLLALMDGSWSISQLRGIFNAEKSQELEQGAFESFLHTLVDLNIVVDRKWKQKLNISQEHRERLDRQLNFMMDMLPSSECVERAISTILTAKLVIFGVGGVASWLVRELAMMGFQNFLLIDPAVSRTSDKVRHPYFSLEELGAPKVQVASRALLQIDPNLQVSALQQSLDIGTDIQGLCTGSNMVINAADRPYIGYTSILLSRYCVKQGLPLLILGGFDAHLASLSELIVPGKTPCADCYDVHFKKVLRDWKPESHPVKDRSLGFGGLSSLSAFSASVAALKVFKYFAGIDDQGDSSRGEFLFLNYEVQTFDVTRNPDCPICATTAK